MDTTPLPAELVDYWIDKLATEATDGTDLSISTVAGPATVSIDQAQTDAHGQIIGSYYRSSYWRGDPIANH